jgi:hypothetical protein
MEQMHDPTQFPKIDIVRPLRAADFRYHARLRSWTNAQTAALCLGVDPRSLETVNLENGPELRPSQMHIGDFIRARAEVSKILDSHFHPRIDRHHPPAFWANWLSDMKLPCPQELAEAVEEFAGASIDWKARAMDAEGQIEEHKTRIAELEKTIVDNAINSSGATRQHDTLLRILIGIAVEQYGYDPRKARNAAASQISSDLQLHGISVSDDTIRKYLSAGSELLPVDP